MIDHRLQVLRMVASRGTVTAAAEALGYTPSAVSHQLRSLARELGVPLLAREGRGVRLTPAARLLLARSEELFARWEEVRAELAATGDRAVGSLRLCGFSTAAAALLPPVAARVAALHPGATVRIIEADPAECFDLLLADDADLAVVVATASLPPSDDPRFEQEPLLDDPLDLLLPADHPLAGEQSVLLEQVAGDHWIMDRPGTAYHQLVVTACAAAGFTPSIAHQATEWDTGAALVSAGLGIALIPRLARLPADYSLARVPLRGDPTPARHLLTGVRRGSRAQPAIATALAALEDVALTRRAELPGGAGSTPPDQ
ncbi:LysR family transcriptional regulator [Nocardioides sp. GXQ0305]|uniref:LysR family transcriptional regulator n=1 Tax=Nocardioides sp. GXQ0305 TaxID=3423912 RepID=UPI003D7D9632